MQETQIIEWFNSLLVFEKLMQEEAQYSLQNLAILGIFGDIVTFGDTEAARYFSV